MFLTLTTLFVLYYCLVDLNIQYQKAGVKNIGTVFILNDAQIADEKFLVLINDLLASGEIPDLFTDDEVENIISSMRNEVKGQGMEDTRENCWRFYIDKVRKTLKVFPILHFLILTFELIFELLTLMCLKRRFLSSTCKNFVHRNFH